jgi:hypothetical protein
MFWPRRIRSHPRAAAILLERFPLWAWRGAPCQDRDRVGQANVTADGSTKGSSSFLPMPRRRHPASGRGRRPVTRLRTNAAHEVSPRINRNDTRRAGVFAHHRSLDDNLHVLFSEIAAADPLRSLQTCRVDDAFTCGPRSVYQTG